MIKIYFLAILFLLCKKPDSSIQTNKINFETINSLKNNVVYISSPKVDRPNGTGIIIDKQGTVLTCYHVLSGIDDSIEIILEDLKTTKKATIIKKEELFDLVLLKTDFKNDLKPPQWASLEEFEISDRVFMFGTPYGLKGSYLEGYIVATDRVDTSLQFPKIPFIQTQGVSFPGNSGGAVFHSSGKIIGINQSTFGFSTGNGIGLTIPTGFVKVFLEKN